MERRFSATKPRSHLVLTRRNEEELVTFIQVKVTSCCVTSVYRFCKVCVVCVEYSTDNSINRSACISCELHQAAILLRFAPVTLTTPPFVRDLCIKRGGKLLV